VRPIGEVILAVSDAAGFAGSASVSPPSCARAMRSCERADALAINTIAAIAAQIPVKPLAIIPSHEYEIGASCSSTK
jgi:hypothetical protein